VKLVDSMKTSCNEETLKAYITRSTWLKRSHEKFAWASLQHFWCVNGKYLARQEINKSSFNRVIGRNESKKYNSGEDSWIAGYKPDPRRNVEAESKKVFSFKKPARTFGFVEYNHEMHWNKSKQLLQGLIESSDKWKDFSIANNFIEGKQIIQLFCMCGD